MCTVLEVDFSSKVWKSTGIMLIFIGTWLYHPEGLVVGLAIWWDANCYFEICPVSKMSLVVKKGKNFKSLIERAEYNFHELWIRYFPAETC